MNNPTPQSTDRLDEILTKYAEWTINNVNHGIYIALPSPETKAAILSWADKREAERVIEARIDERKMIQPYIDEMFDEPIVYEQKNRIAKLEQLKEKTK